MFSSKVFLKAMFGLFLLGGYNIQLHAEDIMSISTGLDYSQGDYGAEVDTEIWYVPVTFKLEKERFIYKITLSYLQITGPGNVIGIDSIQAGNGSNQITTESGIGDVVGALSYTVIPYEPERPMLDITAKIKLPTADESKGLGTGKYDLYLQADTFYSINDSSLFATIGYKKYGDPPQINYRDVIYWSIGGAHRLSGELNAGLMYDYRESATASGSEQEELTLYASKKLDNKKKLMFYFVKGLSEGSPDWGIGTNFSYRL